MLVLSRKLDQAIVIQDTITIKILEISGDRVKLGINAPRDVVILRQELRDEIKQENLDAARQSTDLSAALSSVRSALARD